MLIANVNRYVFTIAFTLLTSFYAFTQENPILGGFSATANKGKVYLAWQILAGRTCNGIKIFRSSDSLNFTQIGDITGVCGSSSKPISYSYIDDTPIKNKKNYYRLELGNQGYSPIISIEIIDIQAEGYQIRPNPINEIGRVYFYNPNKQSHKFILYNLSGNISLSIFSQLDFFDLNVQNLPAGMYFFTITSTENALITSGRLIIQH